MKPQHTLLIFLLATNEFESSPKLVTPFGVAEGIYMSASHSSYLQIECQVQRSFAGNKVDPGRVNQ